MTDATPDPNEAPAPLAPYERITHDQACWLEAQESAFARKRQRRAAIRRALAAFSKPFRWFGEWAPKLWKITGVTVGITLLLDRLAVIDISTWPAFATAILEAF